MDGKAVKIRVTGRVQGVSFRASTQHTALALGLKGWVRNLADGSVEIFAQGAARAVEDFIAWCHKGPPQAKVVAVSVESEKVQENFTAFEIRR
jgi:acylphosphatase